MAFPTRGQVYGKFLQQADDPAGVVFTDIPNPATGALSVFQNGFSEAFDLLFSNALNQQVPRVELVTQGIIIQPSPVPFSVTPAQMGLLNLADFEWVGERAAGSTDKFVDMWDEDRLPQRAPTDRLREYVFQNGAFQFLGCTTVRELQIKSVESGGNAPTDNAAIISFDNSLNFLSNYAVSVAAPLKGYDEIGTRCRSFAVGPKFDQGSIGGELFRLLQPLVRSRQNVPVAPKPFTTQRRFGVRRGPMYASSQFGTTGGGAQNVPVQFSSVSANPNTAIIGAIDGANLVFFLPVPIYALSLFRNGLLQTVGTDYFNVNNMITFFAGSVPQVGDLLTAEATVQYQV